MKCCERREERKFVILSTQRRANCEKRERERELFVTHC